MPVVAGGRGPLFSVPWLEPVCFARPPTGENERMRGERERECGQKSTVVSCSVIPVIRSLRGTALSRIPPPPVVAPRRTRDQGSTPARHVRGLRGANQAGRALGIRRTGISLRSIPRSFFQIAPPPTAPQGPSSSWGMHRHGQRKNRGEGLKKNSHGTRGMEWCGKRGGCDSHAGKGGKNNPPHNVQGQLGSRGK